MVEEPTFPILGTRYRVPLALLAPHEQQARRNHGGQSLATLADRGGLAWSEALAVLQDAEFTRMDETDAHRRFAGTAAALGFNVPGPAGDVDLINGAR